MSEQKKKKETDAAILSALNESVSDLAFWGFRYFLGRASIHAACFADNLANAFHLLHPNVQACIVKELELALTEDDESRKKGNILHPLGHDSERMRWENLYNKGNEHFKNREV